MNNDFNIIDKQVFYKGTLLKSISPENFEPIYFENGIKAFKNKKGVWWFYVFGKKLKFKFLTNDISHFKIINDNYAIDSQSVYLMAKDGYRIPNSDANTFTVLSNTPYFSKDKNQLYSYDSYSGLKILNSIDAKSICEVSWSAFITDKHSLYHAGNSIKIANDQKYLNPLDGSRGYGKTSAEIFEMNQKFLHQKYPDLIGWWHPEYPYSIEPPIAEYNQFYKTEKAVYYLETHNHLDHAVPTLIPSVNHKKFNQINNYYGSDGTSIICITRTVNKVDAKSFEVVEGLLAKDKCNYFFNGYQVNCDYQTFQILERLHPQVVVAIDKNTVYFSKHALFGKIGFRTGEDWVLEPVKNSDPKSFTMYSYAIARDKNQVYFHRKILKKADVNTFEFLFSKGHDHWAKDKNHLYNANGERIVKGISGKDFKMLNTFWGKDKENVFSFVSGRILPSLDYESFEVLDDQGSARDKNYNYFYKSGELKKVKTNS